MNPLRQARSAVASARRRARIRLRTGPAARALSRRRARLNARWRADVLARGYVADATPSSVLVVAPHPDDETIGCGITIARLVASGVPVDVVVVSDGGTSHHSSSVSPARLGELRRAESRAACRVLGVAPERVHFLGLSEADLRRPELVHSRVRAAVAAVDPDELLVVSRSDWHPEHQRVHDACLQAVSELGLRAEVYAYPVWHWADGPSALHPGAGLARQAWDLARGASLVARTPPARLTPVAGFGEVKRRAFAEYLTQTTSYTGEPGWVPFPDGWLDKFVDQFEVAFRVERAPAAQRRARPASRRDAT